MILDILSDRREEWDFDEKIMIFDISSDHRGK